MASREPLGDTASEAPSTKGELKDVCDDFTINRRDLLGHGAFADVYAAESKASGQHVAVKEFRLSSSGRTQEAREDMLAACRAEVRNMELVRQRLPESCPVLFSLGTYTKNSDLRLPNAAGGQYLAMVMPRAEGDLFDAMERSMQSEEGISYDAVASAMADSLRGLQGMHDAGLVHRDVKLENLLLVPGRTADLPQVLLADFGFVAVLGPDGTVRADVSDVVGTLNALAPEVFSEGVYSTKSDVWALASAFYTLCFQQYPVDPVKVRTLYRRMCRHPNPSSAAPALASFISRSTKQALQLEQGSQEETSRAALLDLLGAMLEIEPSARASVADALGHPFLLEHGQAARGGSLPASAEELRRFKNRHRVREAAQNVGEGKFAALLSSLRHVLGGRDMPPMRLESIWGAFRLGLGQDGRGTQGAAESPLSGGGGPLRCVSEKDSGLDRGQFEVTMKALGLGDVNFSRLFAVFDADGNGTVDYKEMVAGLALVQGPSEAALEICFAAFDLDGNGALDAYELGNFVSMLDTGSKSANQDLRDNLETAFVRMDVNGDGMVSWDEFKHGVQADPFLANMLLGKMQAVGGRRVSGWRISTEAEQEDIMRAVTPRCSTALDHGALEAARELSAEAGGKGGAGGCCVVM